MKTPTQSQLNRRLFVQGALLALAAPGAWAAGPCRGPQPGPEGTFARSPFGETSTAEEVTTGLDLSGMTALVTGCNSGLGYETMRVLSMHGAHVIGTARSTKKAETACASIDGKTTPVALELSDFDSVAAAAASINALGMPIDMLICNAGVMALPDLTLDYGIERQFVVNHLGHFLLVNRVIEQVKAAQRGRIVMVSSCAQFQAPEEGIDFDNLDGSKSYSAWTAYGRSKLANSLFAAELSRRLKDSAVTANSLHPGVIKTNLGRHLGGPERAADDEVFNKNIPQGAATQCYVAANSIPAGISGQYFSDCNPAMGNKLMYDEALASKLWTVSEQLINKNLAQPA